MPKAMTTLPILIALIPFVATAPARAQESQALKYTITVTKFDNEAGFNAQFGDIGTAWATVMTDVLNQSGHFIVLGENEMRAEALSEQDFASSGRTAKGARTPETGQMTPAQLLVKGAITHVQSSTSGGGGGVRVGKVKIGGAKEKAEINATIYIIDSTTGQVVASTNVIGKSDRLGAGFGYTGADFAGDFDAFKNDNVGKAVQDAIKEGVDWMVKQLPKIPWSGSVALVRESTVYINRGERDGVTTGQSFKIGKREVIRDPDTGEVLDESVNEVAACKVSEVREKLSICKVVSGNASGIERGMAVFP